MDTIQKNKVKEQVLWTIGALRTKPKMVYCGEDDYLNCRLFIEGYFFGLGHALDFNFIPVLCEWMGNKYKVGSSLSYSLYPEYFHSEKTDAEKKELLLNLIEEYFKEKWLKS